MTFLGTPGPNVWPRLHTSSPNERACPKLGRIWWRSDTERKCHVCGGHGFCLLRSDEVICMKQDSSAWAGPGERVEFSNGTEGHWHPLTPHALDEGINRQPGSKNWEALEESALNHEQAALESDVFVPLPVPPDFSLNDRVYTGVLEYSFLNKWDADDLLRRGLTQEAIARKGYKSVKHLPQHSISELQQRFQIPSFSGIAGFHSETVGNETVWKIRTTRGYFIPCRNSAGQIVSMQIRLGGSNVTTRYIFFSTSSGKFVGGGKAYQQAHVAVPMGADPKKAAFGSQRAH